MAGGYLTEKKKALVNFQSQNVQDDQLKEGRALFCLMISPRITWPPLLWAWGSKVHPGGSKDKGNLFTSGWPGSQRKDHEGWGLNMPLKVVIVYYSMG